MSDIRKLMDATKGYSEVSQEVQEGWLKDTFDKVVDTLGLGPAERNKVTDAAETKTTEIEKIEAEVQAKLNSAANDTYQNDKIDDIANASDAEAKANADAAITKKMDQDNAADAPVIQVQQLQQAIRLLKKYGTKSKQSVILCHKVQNVLVYPI